MRISHGQFEMVIGLTGGIATGKGLAVETILEEFAGRDIQVVLLSDYIREVVRAQGERLTRESLRTAGNARRIKEGPGAWVQEMLRRLPKEGGDILLVDSIRNPFEIHELQSAFGEAVFVLATDAPLEARIERTIKRGRGDDATDPEEIRRDMEIEMQEEPFGFSLRACRELADAVSLGKESKAERVNEIRMWVRDFEQRCEAKEARREIRPLSDEGRTATAK